VELREYVPLASYTSYRIGGPARFFIEPNTAAEVKDALAFARDRGLPYYILGKGTNILVSDKGLPGVVIHIGKRFSQMELTGQQVTVQGGLLLNTLIYKLAEHNLGGFEVLAGIPGSVAGAVVMNAGAHRVFIGEFIEAVDIITAEGQFNTLSGSELGFAYRYSIFQEEKHVILQAHLRVVPREQIDIKKSITLALEKRRLHPQLPSCGSTFRNPPGIPAGKLIEELGLKGTRIGDAQIAPEHGNFIVNLGKATAQDVYSLIRLVQAKARKERGITLQTEVKLWGEFENPPG
jgi:UDP-N-acetylmuramate dehydrogenase